VRASNYLFVDAGIAQKGCGNKSIRRTEEAFIYNTSGRIEAEGFRNQ
jgi:hypothetical protein